MGEVINTRVRIICIAFIKFLIDTTEYFNIYVKNNKYKQN